LPQVVLILLSGSEVASILMLLRRERRLAKVSLRPKEGCNADLVLVDCERAAFGRKDAQWRTFS